MSKGYFIVLPEWHTKEVFMACLEIIKGVSGIKLSHSGHHPSAVYLVVRGTNGIIRWGTLEDQLTKIKQDPNMVELPPVMENV